MAHDLPDVQPKKHIRRPGLPWRDETRTECGRDAEEMAEGVIITVKEAIAFWKKQGAQRASLFVCSTCVDAANRWRSWEDDPVSRLGRELPSSGYFRRERDHDEWDAELRAIADLIHAHRDEFNEAKASYLRRSIVAIDAKRGGPR